MSLAVRVIPCLDVAAGRVVKGVNFQNLRDAGDPVELAARYAEQGADELTFLDVTATVDDRSTTYDMVQRSAEQVFIPLTVGGGVRSSRRRRAAARPRRRQGRREQCRHRAARRSIAEIADRFGAQVLVLSLDVKRSDRTPSGFVVTTHGGRTETDLDALAWARKAIELGAGELLVNSIDADGTKQGFDLELLGLMRELSSVPVIASGGAGGVALRAGDRGRRRRRARGIRVPQRRGHDRRGQGGPGRRREDRAMSEERRSERTSRRRASRCAPPSTPTGCCPRSSSRRAPARCSCSAGWTARRCGAH